MMALTANPSELMRLAEAYAEACAEAARGGDDATDAEAAQAALAAALGLAGGAVGSAAPIGPIVLALARAARPREHSAVMHHLQRLVEALRAGGDTDLAAALEQLAEEPEHPFVPVRHADAGEPESAGRIRMADCPVCGGAGSVPTGQAAGLAITPATLSQMLGIKMRPILLALMRGGQSVTVNQKLTEDQIAFLIQHGVDR